MEASPALFAVRACLPNRVFTRNGGKRGKKMREKIRGGSRAPAPFPPSPGPGTGTAPRPRRLRRGSRARGGGGRRGAAAVRGRWPQGHKAPTGGRGRRLVSAVPPAARQRGVKNRLLIPQGSAGGLRGAGGPWGGRTSPVRSRTGCWHGANPGLPSGAPAV